MTEQVRIESAKARARRLRQAKAFAHPNVAYLIRQNIAPPEMRNKDVL
jgi:hypothetical protein